MKNSVKPYTPKDVESYCKAAIPDQVIDIVNELLVKHASRSPGRITISQSEIVDNIVASMKVNRNVIFDEGYLNFEDLYSAAGWMVEHHKSSYGDQFASYFVFSRKNNNTVY